MLLFVICVWLTLSLLAYTLYMGQMKNMCSSFYAPVDRLVFSYSPITSRLNVLVFCIASPANALIQLMSGDWKFKLAI